MALLVPNLEASPTFDAQAIPDATDLAAQLAAIPPTLTGVSTGCQVSQQTSPNMTVQVGAGSVLVGGVTVAVAAVSSLTIAAADASDRRDIVVVNNSGVVSVVKGTDCGTAGWSRSTSNPLTTNPPPVKPAIPANSVLLGEVYVAASTTSIATGNIIDKTNPAGVLSISSGSALQLSLTETVSYPPVSALKGNTALWIQQNETFTALPPVTAISGDGVSTWTVTFASSIVGPLGSTLGQVGDTFKCWTVDFLPIGWNTGNLFSTVTATITSSTQITIPGGSFNTTATQLGTVQPLPVQSTAGFFGDRSIAQIEGTNSFARVPDQTDGLGPAYQVTMTYRPATAVTATFSFTTGANTATLTGTPPAGIFVGMNVADTTTPSNLPFGTVVGNVYYTIATNTTTITLLNKYSFAAQNPLGNSGGGGDVLSFSADVLSAEQYIAGSYTRTTGQSVQYVPNTLYPNQNFPGSAQNWGQGYWSGPAWLGDSTHTLTAIQQADFISAMFTGQGAHVAERVGFSFNDVSKATGGSQGSLGNQIGFSAGLWTGIAPALGVAAADNGTALSSLGTLTVVGNTATTNLGLLPQIGSGVIYCSDGMHAFNWTGISGATFTGCTYSGNQAATVATGNPVNINPQFLTPVFGASTMGMVNAAPAAFPNQAPTATVTSAVNGLALSSIPLTSSTVAAGSNGVSFATLTSGTGLQLASTASFGASGMGTIAHSGHQYIFTWTANNTGTNTLTIGAITGLQTLTVATGDTVTAGNVLPVSSVQWFPDDGGSLYVSAGPAGIGQLTYAGTTATYVSGTSSATALSSSTGIPAAAGAGVLTVTSTAFLPVAGTAIIVTSGGQGTSINTVSWTGIGSATTLTGCTYTGTTANTVINGGQLFLTSTSTGPSGLGPAFFGCSYVSTSSALTLATGQTVMGAPGGTFQTLTLPNSAGPLICVGPGFQLPQPTASKMALVAQAASTGGLAVPAFTGLNPSYDGQEVKLVVSRIPSATTITFTSETSSVGTLLSLGAATRAVAVGGSLWLGWDSSSRTSGEWIEYASNLGAHG